MTLLLSTSLLALVFWNFTARNPRKIVPDTYMRPRAIHRGISSGHPLATQAGMEILEQGGNAVDAAVAVAYALGVVEPYACGLGGGGEMVIYWNQSRQVRVIDFREAAPQSFNINHKFTEIGLPGFVKGMEYLLQKYGTFSRSALMRAAIDYAQNGIPVSHTLAEILAQYNGAKISPQNTPAFFDGSRPLQAGAIIYQNNLAFQLKKIAQDGENAFYTQQFIQSLGNTNKKKIPPFVMRDFPKYHVRDTTAVRINFCDYEIFSTPPPGGGITLTEMLKLAEISQASRPLLPDESRIPLLLQATAIAYNDRRKYLGDPRFGVHPPAWINQKKYLQKRWQEFDNAFNFTENNDEQSTTHFVIVDALGNWVSCTLTLGNFFGNGIMSNGFFLNNGLSKFSTVYNSPNAPSPGKRPFSYMAPTLVFKSGNPFLALGSPGGRRIPAILTEMLICHLRDGVGLKEAVQMPRYYLSPERQVFFEEPPPPGILSNLKKRGFRIVTGMSPLFYGAIQALEIDQKTGSLIGVADPRREGDFACQNLAPDGGLPPLIR